MSFDSKMPGDYARSPSAEDPLSNENDESKKEEAGFDEISSDEIIEHLTDDDDASELTSISPKPSSIGTGSRKRVLAGKYLLEREIARGAMGHVFLATQINLKRRVAVKVLIPQNSGADFDKRFLLEAQMAAGLSHRNIVIVHDYGQSKNDLLFMAMEYLNGPTLGRLMARTGPLPVGRACNIILQVARALRCAHRAGVVHRDLKPGNVMIIRGDDDEGEVAKVLDFGLVKVFEKVDTEDVFGEPLTRDGLMLGTPRYMAPEQIIGKDVDPRSDIYALGAVFYRMLSGRHPFTGEHDVEILNAQLKTNPIPLREQPGCEGIPPEIEELIAHAMKRKIEDRLESAAEFIRRLREIISSAMVDPTYRAMFQVGESGGFPAAALALNSLTGNEGSSSGSRQALHEDIKSSRPRLNNGLITPATPTSYPGVGDSHISDSIPPSTAAPVTSPGEELEPSAPPPNDLAPDHYEYTTSGPPPRKVWPIAAGIGLVLALAIGALSLLNEDPADPVEPVVATKDLTDPDRATPPPPRDGDEAANPDDAPPADEPPAEDAVPAEAAPAEQEPAKATTADKKSPRRVTRRPKPRSKPRAKPKKVASKPPPPPEEEEATNEDSVAVGGTLLAAPQESTRKKKRKKKRGEKVGGFTLASPDDVERDTNRKKSVTDPNQVDNDGTILADDYQ